MRAILKSEADRGIEYRVDVAEPLTGPNDVLIEVAAGSVCGTDRELFEWTPSAQAFDISVPVVMGHECSGTVLAVGAEVKHMRPGTRVAVESHLPCLQCFPCRTGNAHNCANLRILGMHFNGGFAERLSVPAYLCVPLPDEISLEIGALLESAGVGLHAIQRADYGVAGAQVLINGCGPVGLVIAQLSILMGATSVVCIEPNPYRRRMATNLGALALHPSDDVIGQCRALSGKRGGFDVAFEASGVSGVLLVLLESVRREGPIITVGHPGKPAELNVAEFINRKGISLRGIFGRRLWDTWEQMMLLLSSDRLTLDWLITHRLPLDQFELAIDLLSGDAGKVLLVP